MGSLPHCQSLIVSTNTIEVAVLFFKIDFGATTSLFYRFVLLIKFPLKILLERHFTSSF